MIVRSEQRCFGGVQGFYEHTSEACGGPMRFSVFLPPQALAGDAVPAVYCLAGLTCTEETFMIKAGAQRGAAQLGLALVSCDTSPRATRFAGDDANWDFGIGAGFYLDAELAPWSSVYRMHRYVWSELRALVEQQFRIRADVRGVLGHSMGGHGALTLALKHPDDYQSVSAFAPIVAPSQVPWGIKAFSNYLGEDRARWADWDAVELVKRATIPRKILIDQGGADQFLERELRPQLFADACSSAGQALELRLRPEYDHSYWFIASHIDDHLRHHANALLG